jgi:hypothetical protein
VKGIQVCSNKWPGSFQRGDNHRNIKKGLGHLKIFFFRTIKPEKLNFTWKLSDLKLIWLKSWPPRVEWG